MSIEKNRKYYVIFGVLIVIIIGLIFLINNMIFNLKGENYNLEALNNEEVKFIDIEEINKYEFTMENNLYSRENDLSYSYNVLRNNYSKDFNFEYIPFLKISNQKLFWNVNNDWVEDKVISEEIIYANYFSTDVTVYKFLIITKNNIYIIEIPDGIDTISEILKDQAMADFISKYNNLKYVTINKVVSNVVEKYKPEGCNLYKEIYLLIDNNVYFVNLESNDVMSIDTKENNFSNMLVEYLDRCETNEATISIDKDGKVHNSNIDHSKINNIKYYLKNNKFEMIIDLNNNYYLKLYDNNYYGKIDDLNFNKLDKSLILASNNSKIFLKEVSNSLYD